MDLDEAGREKTLTALLDRENGLYPRAQLNVPGLAAVLALRADTGRLARPLPPVDRCLDLSYYEKAAEGSRKSH